MKPLSAYVSFTEDHEERYAWRPVRLEDGWCWLRNYIVVNKRTRLPSDGESIVFRRRISIEQWLIEKFKG
jgi:hypothetical protein